MATENSAFPKGKIAIVTGGSRGLGRNTVLNLADRGVSSILTFNSNRAEAEKVVGLVTKTGAKAIPLQLDTGDAASFDSFVESVRGGLTQLGSERFDYLVNNAGTHSSRKDKSAHRKRPLSSLIPVLFFDPPLSSQSRKNRCQVPTLEKIHQLHPCLHL
jgi:NAD(P)-dependent dehydrogenase (short-subunit alcohol dehydrogenase family)